MTVIRVFFKPGNRKLRYSYFPAGCNPNKHIMNGNGQLVYATKSGMYILRSPIQIWLGIIRTLHLCAPYFITIIEIALKTNYKIFENIRKSFE